MYIDMICVKDCIILYNIHKNKDGVRIWVPLKMLVYQQCFCTLSVPVTSWGDLHQVVPS